MALRVANKIHCVVNNVVSQGLRLQANRLKPAPAPPKTRYPLNQQDANSYIEQLKLKSMVQQAVDPTNPDVVRSFKVEIDVREPRTSAQFAQNHGMRLVQRSLTTKAGKGKGKGDKRDCPEQKVQCKKGGKVDKDKCPKVEPPCPQFKIDNCKAVKDFNCVHRKFVFQECKKAMAPYPSFSEACFEPLPPSFSDCKNCPWAHAPTFKPPINKFVGAGAAKSAGKGKKKFHTLALTAHTRKFHTATSNCITLRFGEPTKTEKDLREEELQNQPYAVRPNYLIRKRLAEMYIATPRALPPSRPAKVRKFNFKRLPEDQCGPAVVYRSDNAVQSRMEVMREREQARMEKTLETIENMILAKNRVRVTGAPQCGNQDCQKKGGPKKKKCGKKIKSKICPKDLLDRRPYKKFRDGKKKKGKKHHKHHHKKASGVEGSEESMEAMVMEQMTARPPQERPSM